MSLTLCLFLTYVTSSLALFSHKEVMHLKELVHEECEILHKCPMNSVRTVGSAQCSGGTAGEFDCNNINLHSFVPLAALGAGKKADGSDIWGWTDSLDGREYAIFNAADGTSFVDVTTPTDPIVLAFLPTATVSSMWHDVKVFKNYAFIVSEASQHGMQVFDLTRLRDPVLRSSATDRHNTDASQVTRVTADFHYTDFGASHNIFINEDTATAYVVGSTQGNKCNSVIHMIDISNPLQPQFVGCAGDTTFTYCHDVQCVIYQGPDARYHGREICFGFMGDAVGIMDVTDRANVKTLYSGVYNELEFCHQGWLFDSSAGVQSRMVFNDELDELTHSPFTRSLVYDVSDLQQPKLLDVFVSKMPATDHNNYVHSRNGQQYVYQSNYAAGLRVLKVADANNGLLQEVASFDVSPDFSGAGFHGTWSNYPYFPSGTIVVSSIERGLFVLDGNSIP